MRRTFATLTALLLLLTSPLAAADTTPPTASTASPNPVTWTNTYPLLSASFFDADSGLKDAEYSVGSSPVTTDVQGWTRLAFQGWGADRQRVASFPSSVEAVAVADLDGDGYNDGVFGAGSQVHVMWGPWPGSIPTIATMAGAIRDIHVADYDADGDLDIFVTHDLEVTVLEQISPGVFTPVNPVPTYPDFTTHVRAIDAEGDGDMDAFVGYGSRVGLLQQHDLLGWQHQDLGEHCPSSAVNGLDAADVDSDGDADVVLVCNSGQIKYLQQVGGVFAATTLATSCGSLYDVAIRDLDGQGGLDAVAVGLCGDVHVLLNDSGWTHTPIAVSPFANLEGVDAADMDGDGDLDVVVGTIVDGRYKAYRNDGAGSFTHWFDSTKAGGQVRDLVFGQVNADLGPDIVSGHTGGDVYLLTAEGYAGTYDWVPDVLMEGVNEVNVRLGDWAGNTDQWDGFFQIQYDVSPPTADALFARAPDANGWYNAPIGWSTTASDAVSGIDAVRVCTPACGSWVASAGGTYGSDGTYSLRVEARDLAGNTGAGPTRLVQIDATDPAASGSMPAGTHTSPPTIDIDFTDATSGVWEVVYRVGASYGDDSHSSGDQVLASYASDGQQHTADWSIPMEHLRDGDNFVQAIITDRAGNTATTNLGVLDMDIGELLVTSAHDAAGDPVSLAWGQWSGRPGELVNGTTWIKVDNTKSTMASFTLELPSSLTGPASMSFADRVVLYHGTGSSPAAVAAWSKTTPATTSVTIDVPASSTLWIGYEIALPGVVEDGAYTGNVSWTVP